MNGNVDHSWVVDGIEEGIARIEEDGVRMISLPVGSLPRGVKEGDVLRVTGKPRPSDGDTESFEVSISIDPTARAAALARSKAANDATMAESKKRDPGGNVSL